MPVRPKTLAQIVSTYKKMAVKARYRPAAPSDGMGHVTAPLEELDLEQEALEYAVRWNEEENQRTFHVGVCNFPTRPATIFAVEAARNMCGTNDHLALTLLRMAVSELEQRLEEPSEHQDGEGLQSFLGDDAIIAAIETWAEDHSDEFMSAIGDAFDVGGQQLAVRAKPVGIKRVDLVDGQIEAHVTFDITYRNPIDDEDLDMSAENITDYTVPVTLEAPVVRSFEYHDLVVTPGGGY